MIGLLQRGGFQNRTGLEYGVGIENRAPLSILEIKENTVTKKHKRKKKRERYPASFRFTLEQYEYVARLAKSAIHNSMQRIIDDKIFSRPWKEELETLRQQQERLRYPESDFFPLAYKRKIGIKGKQGRRPRAIFNRVA